MITSLNMRGIFARLSDCNVTILHITICAIIGKTMGDHDPTLILEKKEFGSHKAEGTRRGFVRPSHLLISMNLIFLYNLFQKNRDQERIETLWTDRFEDLLVEETVENLTEAPRSPRQTQGKQKQGQSRGCFIVSTIGSRL